MLYQLHVFLMAKGLPFLIDSLINPDKEYLVGDATARKQNNPDYRCVLVTYKAEDANIV